MNCENCKHFYEDQSEYHWCHMCQMEKSCYSPIEKDGEHDSAVDGTLEDWTAGEESRFD